MSRTGATLGILAVAAAVAVAGWVLMETLREAPVPPSEPPPDVSYDEPDDPLVRPPVRVPDGPPVEPNFLKSVPPTDDGDRPVMLEDVRAMVIAGDRRKAFVVLDRFIERNPKNADALAYRAKLQLEDGPEWSRRAEDDYRRAIEIGGETAERLAGRALALARLRSFGEAAKLAKRALELDEKFARGHAVLALVQLSGDRKKEARAEAEKALALDPKDPVARQVLYRLE